MMGNELVGDGWNTFHCSGHNAVHRLMTILECTRCHLIFD